MHILLLGLLGRALHRDQLQGADSRQNVQKARQRVGPDAWFSAISFPVVILRDLGHGCIQPLYLSALHLRRFMPAMQQVDRVGDAWNEPPYRKAVAADVDARCPTSGKVFAQPVGLV